MKNKLLFVKCLMFLGSEQSIIVMKRKNNRKINNTCKSIQCTKFISSTVILALEMEICEKNLVVKIPWKIILFDALLVVCSSNRLDSNQTK